MNAHQQFRKKILVIIYTITKEILISSIPIVNATELEREDRPRIITRADTITLIESHFNDAYCCSKYKTRLMRVQHYPLWHSQIILRSIYRLTAIARRRRPRASGAIRSDAFAAKDALKNREWHLHGQPRSEKECLQVPPLETLAAKVGSERKKTFAKGFWKILWEFLTASFWDFNNKFPMLQRLILRALLDACFSLLTEDIQGDC